MSKPKFDVLVRLTDCDGNAFLIMGAVTKALREAGVSKDEIDAYLKSAMSGDYDHLLRVTMQTVAVE